MATAESGESSGGEEGDEDDDEDEDDTVKARDDDDDDDDDAEGGFLDFLGLVGCLDRLTGAPSRGIAGCGGVGIA